MTAVMESALTAEAVHEHIQSVLATIDVADEARLGLVNPKVHELDFSGASPHRFLVIDESVQPGGSFKANGMALAVDRYLLEEPHPQRVYTGTAGNAGASLAWAAQSRGTQAVLVVPNTLRPIKQANIERYGGKIITAESALVVEAIAQARAKAKEDPAGRFVHAYDDRYALAGQGMVARRTARKLGGLGVVGPVIQMVQRGGGSLAAASASVGREYGWRTYEVRPRGDVDSRYDGLAVASPGDMAAAILYDTEFVQGTEVVDDGDTGRAALAILSEYGRAYEPSALAGVAAALRHARSNPDPTTYIAVLSGRNAPADALTEFVDKAFDEQDTLGIPALTNTANKRPDFQQKLFVACGATALLR